MNKSRSDVPLVVILGNIGSGKTTLTKNVNETFGKVLSLPEPVAIWKECGILQDFYDNMEKKALAFQMFAFATRAAQFKGIEWLNYDFCLADSHIIADQHVFTKNLVGMQKMTEKESDQYSIFCQNWKTLVPEMVPNKWIYLQTSAETCMERIKKRRRPEEEKITADYLRGLQFNFESMIEMPEIKENLVVIDAEEDEETVKVNVLKVVASLL